MPPIRSALRLLATIMLLSPAAGAEAATSKLTPTPPMPLTGSPTMQPTTTSIGAIPRTGDELPLQGLVAGILIAAGTALRLSRSPDRG